MKRIVLFTTVILFSFFVLSCKQEESYSVDASLKGFGYYINNYPNDIWSATATIRPSLSYNFDMVFSGTLSRDDIVSARVYINDSGYYWTLDPRQFDQSLNAIFGYNYWYTTSTYELPIGELTAKIELIDGTKLSKTIIMGIPGSKSNGVYQYVYNPDDESFPNYPSVSYKALQRPIVTEFNHSLSTVDVSFTIIGDNVNNGYIWYYDDSNTFIGNSTFFRDPITGSCFSGLNNGIGFNSSDGDNNIFISSISTISKNNTQITTDEFNSITRARVVVLDGAQYESTSVHSVYDYRAVSFLSE